MSTALLDGNWTLVSYEREENGGRVTYPQGPNPIGRISYEPSRRMSAMMMRSRRTGGASIQSTEAIRSAEADELREMVGGFIAYYGTYEVDDREGTVSHHIQACLFPGWVGTVQKRRYELQGNRLVLTAVKEERGGGVSELRLVLEREEC